jgi:hypothetical protein
MVEAPGIEPRLKTTIQQESSSIRDRLDGPIETQSDAKCPIARERVTARDSRSSEARAAWDVALGASLRARAVELAEVAAARGDAVSRALLDALARAEAAEDWREVAELARALEAHRKARAGVVPLDLERARRGKG